MNSKAATIQENDPKLEQRVYKWMESQRKNLRE
jgi:hypothetical protein